MGIKDIWKRRSDQAADDAKLHNSKDEDSLNMEAIDDMIDNPEKEDSSQGEGEEMPSPELLVSAGKVMEAHSGGFVKSYLALMLLVCILMIGASLSGEHRPEENTDNRAGLETESAYPGEARAKEEPETETITEKAEGRSMEKTSEAALTESDEIREDRFFGSENPNVAQRQIYVTGLSSSEKQKLSFRESSFTKAVSDFLGNERIDARTIEFSKRLAVSVEGAQEYLAVMPGHDDLYLIVLIYPEFPGRYVLSLLDMRGLGTQSQVTVPGQENANAASSGNMVQSAQVPSTAIPETNAYDATALSVLSVPSTLVNYLDNRYELQYTLYDFLYRNGKRDVAAASVENYTIDPDNRIATISLKLDDGSLVTGTYKKDTNEYSYSF